ncbi:lysylphosphatidylglycerol synthase transmembrane domain-containing protein [Streptomyces sp. JJ38]|uniref:lysylphosphatidylglycerol synthase transmembrane domain-containing protein n=1 Tax=Streptomyces sp. JJ38 TaxID=2738128 RepID=UPI0027E0A05D|nr:lysylphosphatidylglycerol synthase transmembrane domain-containing protein [Streptomyces sp. JJ38]
MIRDRDQQSEQQQPGGPSTEKEGGRADVAHPPAAPARDDVAEAPAPRRKPALPTTRTTGTGSTSSTETSTGTGTGTSTGHVNGTARAMQSGPAAGLRHLLRRAAGWPPHPEGDGSDRLESDEPLLSARVHRPSDLMRLLLGTVGIAVVLAIAYFAHATTAGIEQDIDKGAGQAPPLVISILGVVSSIAVLIVPVAFAIERLIKRDGLRIADGVLAAVLAHGVSLTAALWIAEAAPLPIQEAFTKPAPGGGMTDPVHNYLGPVIAYMTAVGMARRPRWRVLLWVVLLADALSVLISGYTTSMAIVLTVLIGWSVAYGTVYAVGSPNVRPTGQNLLAGLRRVGFSPVTALRAEDGYGDHDRGRRYVVTMEEGPPLDVTIVDREQQAHGYFYRAWRRLVLRGIGQRRSLQSLRQALEQEALLAYAAIAAGANAPKLIATSELGPDAVMLVYEHIGGRPLDALPDDEVTDTLMEASWRQVRALQSRRIAHRRLSGDALLVDRSGAVFLTDLRVGEIAAGDISLRMDVSQLLTTFGLRVGAQRAVRAAVNVLGPDTVADSLPLLQPLALSRSTRHTLRRLAKERAERERERVLEVAKAHREAREARSKDSGEPQLPEEAARSEAAEHDRAEAEAVDRAVEETREEDLLSQIRQEVLLIRPQAPVVPVQLERIRPRTLVSFIAGALAAYFLLTQLTHGSFTDLVSDAHWGWVAFAVAASAMSYVGAALSLLGFVPEKVPFPRTVAAQVAGSFVKLVAPAAIGGVALNTRFLQRAGVRPGYAVASVGASQLFALSVHVLLLLSFGYITGKEQAPSIPPSRTVIAGLLTAAVLVLVVSAIPPLRRFVVTRLRVLFAGVVPRMLDVVQRPTKLASGIGGMLLLTVAFVLCLDASVRAFGGEVSFAMVAVVFLAGNALGSAAPTPGGLGAVEGALIFGLTTLGGLGEGTAISAVLLFRLLTFWLPVLPGWLAFTRLTARKAL